MFASKCRQNGHVIMTGYFAKTYSRKMMPAEINAVLIGKPCRGLTTGRILYSNRCTECT